MIIHDFHVVGVAAKPYKADAPLVVDADTVLSFAIAFHRFQMIAWWSPQIAKFDGDIQLPQLTLGRALKCPKASDALAGVNLFRFSRPERLNHHLSV